MCYEYVVADKSLPRQKLTHQNLEDLSLFASLASHALTLEVARGDLIVRSSLRLLFESSQFFVPQQLAVIDQELDRLATVIAGQSDERVERRLTIVTSSVNVVLGRQIYGHRGASSRNVLKAL